MKYRISFSHKAFVDIEAIVEYYFKLNRTTASKYYHGVFESVKKLISFPKWGRIVTEFEESFYDKYRELLYEHYRIIYRIEEDVIIIIRVIDSRRLLDISIVLSKQ
jgi:plasmid stabilization system protein ParE